MLTHKKGIESLKADWPRLRDEGESPNTEHGGHHIVSIPEEDYLQSLEPKAKVPRPKVTNSPRPEKKPQPEVKPAIARQPLPVLLTPDTGIAETIDHVDILREKVVVVLHKNIQLTVLSTMRPVEIPAGTHVMKLAKSPSSIRWIGYQKEGRFIGKPIGMWEMLVNGAMSECGINIGDCTIENLDELKKL